MTFAEARKFCDVNSKRVREAKNAHPEDPSQRDFLDAMLIRLDRLDCMLSCYVSGWNEALEAVGFDRDTLAESEAMEHPAVRFDRHESPQNALWEIREIESRLAHV